VVAVVVGAAVLVAEASTTLERELTVGCCCWLAEETKERDASFL